METDCGKTVGKFCGTRVEILMKFFRKSMVPQHVCIGISNEMSDDSIAGLVYPTV